MTLILTENFSIPKEYINFLEVFSKKSMIIVFKCSSINNLIINMQPNKQQLYRPNYSLDLIELKILKTYIEANLANKFTQTSKFFTKAIIFFIQIPDGSFSIYVNYCNLNNPIIQKYYLLPLIGKLLDQLKNAKQFIQLKLTSMYHCLKMQKSDEQKTSFKT